MGLLPTYIDFDDKRQKFASNQEFSRIDTVSQFDQWYKSLQIRLEEKAEKAKVYGVNTDHMFRGMGEAKYKLLTSSQRFWISHQLEDWWTPRKYLEFVEVFVDNARKTPLFKKVFDYYNIKAIQRDFPLLSILQHYGAPTPFMDWSYNLDVTLFFATQNAYPSYSRNEIDQYFSVYHLDKSLQIKREFMNLLEWNQGSYPRISSFYDWPENGNAIFYISDFEGKGSARSFRDERPITTFYNQNIIPQEGLFIFNPYPQRPLEDCFDVRNIDEVNLHLIPFTCYNIKKDLGEYIRRKIKLQNIDEAFIYPELRSFCNNLTEQFLDQAADLHK